MKTLLILLFAPVMLIGQSLNVGVSYGAYFDFTPKMKLINTTLSPSVDVVFGIDGLKGYVSISNNIQAGIRAGNYGLFAGMGFMYIPQAIEQQKQVLFFEFGYEREIKKNISVFISTKHGVTLEETKYLACPLSIGVNYKLTK